MLTDDQSRRDCRPWERPWQTFCVDKNLEDDWLERLNALNTFHLISICEGHPKGSTEIPHRPTHFNLRSKDEFINQLMPDWEIIKDQIAEALARSFNTANTSAHFELRTGFIKDKKGVAAQDIILLKVTRQPDLLSPQPTAPLHTWFNENVAAAETFDNLCTSLASH